MKTTRRRMLAVLLLVPLLLGLFASLHTLGPGHRCAALDACPVCACLDGDFCPLFSAIGLAFAAFTLLILVFLPLDGAGRSFYLTFVFPGTHMND